MKRSFVLFGTLVIGALSFSSCNKNLKDDIKELQKQNSEMQEKLKGIATLLGTDEPITATTTFKDSDGKTVTIKDTYSFKASGASTQALVKYPDGHYEIYIERFSDVNWNEGAWVAFNYNPTTKAITRKRGGQYWDNFASYNDNARYDENYFNTGLTFNINIKNIDLASGVISLEVKIDGTEDYTNGVDYWYVPRTGTAITTSFNFDGKLRTFESNYEPS